MNPELKELLDELVAAQEEVERLANALHKLGHESEYEEIYQAGQKIDRVLVYSFDYYG